MKKLLVLMAMASLVLGSQATGTIIVQDDFSYGDGDLAGNGAAGAGWAGAWTVAQQDGGTPALTLISGTVSAPVEARSRVQRTLATPLGDDDTTVYIGFDYDFGTFFNGVEFYTGGTREWAVDFQSSGGQGLRAGSNTIDLNAYTGTSRYVLQIDFGAGNADTATAFVDGASIGSTTTSTDLSFDRFSVAAFSQNGATTGGVDFLDNLVIATTFAEASIPEPATLVLLGLGGLFLLRRRK